jgi:ABC-type lipoprotein release transport system permease subunit
MEGYLALIMPIVMAACGVWIGVLAMLNVRRRYAEIGIMQTLGHGPGKVATLFLGRSVIIGLIGALLGFWVGTLLAMRFGPEIFQITTHSLKPDYLWLAVLVILAPVFAAVSSFIPVVLAITRDPAFALREE